MTRPSFFEPLADRPEGKALIEIIKLTQGSGFGLTPEFSEIVAIAREAFFFDAESTRVTQGIGFALRMIVLPGDDCPTTLPESTVELLNALSVFIGQANLDDEKRKTWDVRLQRALKVACDFVEMEEYLPSPFFDSPTAVHDWIKKSESRAEAISEPFQFAGVWFGSPLSAIRWLLDKATDIARDLLACATNDEGYEKCLDETANLFARVATNKYGAAPQINAADALAGAANQISRLKVYYLLEHKKSIAVKLKEIYAIRDESTAKIKAQAEAAVAKLPKVTVRSVPPALLENKHESNGSLAPIEKTAVIQMPNEIIHPISRPVGHIKVRCLFESDSGTEPAGIFTDDCRADYPSWEGKPTADYGVLLLLINDRPLLYHRARRPRLEVMSAKDERPESMSYFDIDSTARWISVDEAKRWFQKQGKNLPKIAPFNTSLATEAAEIPHAAAFAMLQLAKDPTAKEKSKIMDGIRTKAGTALKCRKAGNVWKYDIKSWGRIVALIKSSGGLDNYLPDETTIEAEKQKIRNNQLRE